MQYGATEFRPVLSNLLLMIVIQYFWVISKALSLSQKKKRCPQRCPCLNAGALKRVTKFKPIEDTPRRRLAHGKRKIRHLVDLLQGPPQRLPVAFIFALRGLTAVTGSSFYFVRIPLTTHSMNTCKSWVFQRHSKLALVQGKKVEANKSKNDVPSKIRRFGLRPTTWEAFVRSGPA